MSKTTKNFTFTCILFLLSFILEAQTTTTIAVENSTFNSGYVEGTGTGPFVKYNDKIRFRRNTATNGYRYGYMRFNLSSIPQNSVITSVKCSLNVYTSGPSNTATYLRRMIADPQSADANSIATAAISGAVCNEHTWNTSGWQVLTFDINGVSQIQGALSSGYIGLVLESQTTQNNTWVLNGCCDQYYQNERPILEITYTAGCAEPMFTYQPVSQSICGVGEKVIFSSTAVNATSFKWQRNGVDISNTGSYSGATSSTLTINPVTSEHIGVSFRCIAINNCPVADTSNIVQIIQAGISEQPQDVFTEIGSTATFSITPTVQPDVYRWQVSIDNGNTFTTITEAGSSPVYSGLFTQTLTLQNIQAEHHGYMYRCVLQYGEMPECILGQAGAGSGHVFYCAGQNKGYEAAPVSAEAFSNWGYYNDVAGTSDAIGAGQANTLAILANNPHHTIAKICNDLDFGNKTDWFTPSKGELNQMYINLKAQGIGNFSNEYYWSSTQESSVAGWFQNFTNGNQLFQEYSGQYSKGNFMKIRCIRTFDVGGCVVTSNNAILNLGIPDVDCANAVSPAHNASQVETNEQLQWSAVSGATSYNVYFGVSNPPQFFESTTNTYSNPEMEYETTYYWKIVPKIGNVEAENCDVWSFTTSDEPEPEVLTWTGVISKEWNVAGNWNLLYVPTATDDILIPQIAPQYFYPEIDETKLTPAVCKDIHIYENAKLTILPNKALTVHGNLLNEGNLFIKSTQVGDGSLLVNGTQSGNGTFTVDRYFTGNFWHLISSPVSNALANVFMNIWLREHNESTNSWGGIIVNPSTPLVIGKGYGVWSYEESEIRSFSGKANNGTIHFQQLALTGSPGPQKGWNLISNPYPSAISWNLTNGWNKQGISSTIYLYSSFHGNYITWNGFVGAAGPKIAMGQGFFVQATSPNVSMSINNQARLHDEVPFRRDEEPEDIISIEVTGNNYSDALFVLYRADATDGFDFNYDAVKMPGLPAAPQLFAQKEDNGEIVNLAVIAENSTDKIDGKIVFLEVGVNAQYTLSYTHSFLQNFNPLVRDRFTDVIIQPDTEYVFTAQPNDNNDRFEIIEAGTVSAQGFKEEGLLIWQHNNVLYAHNIQGEFLQISIFDISGKEVLNSASKETNLNTLAQGVYIVRVITDNQTVVRKISVL
jgi:hypothetical protein